MTDFRESSRDVPIDWFLAVRKYGWERANALEDRREELERTLGREVTLEQVIAAAGFDCEQFDPRDAAEPHSVFDLDDEGVGL